MNIHPLSRASSRLSPGLTGVGALDDWREDAACVPYDPELWFPAGGASDPDPALCRTARMVCVQCPVRAQCLDAALAEESGGRSARYGIRGGLTGSERWDIASFRAGRGRRRRRRTSEREAS